MFTRLREKWKVNAWQLAVILVCFAVAGSLTGYAGRKLMQQLAVEQPVLWTVIYIALVTVLWPLFVIAVSIPLGQFTFFSKYLINMGRHLGIKGTRAANQGDKAPVNIAIFASGAGSNAAKIIEHFGKRSKLAPSADQPDIRVGLVVCNKPEAGVLQIAAHYSIPTLLIDKEKFFRGNAYVDELKTAGIDFIVLAGFLWKIPPALIAAYPNKIVNIHPALLPKYGGKGMYGAKVHEAVIDNKETESGISIHWVDEQYDHGSNIFQARCPVLPGDNAEALAERIHQLEHRHYPQVIEDLVVNQLSNPVTLPS